MKRAVLLLALAACPADSGDDYPIRPGIPGPIGSVPGGDAGAGGDGGDGDAGTPITGRVCLLTDLRQLSACATTGALGLRVSLGTRTTTTNNQAGAFAIIAPLGAGFTWHVTDTNQTARIMSSAMAFGADHTIPVFGNEAYRELVESNEATFGDLQGSVVVRVVNGAQAAVGVVASVAGVDNVRYDGNSSVVWNTGTVGTSTNGVVWLPVLDTAATPTPITITLAAPPGPVIRTAQAVVEDQTITFVTRDIQVP